MSSPSTVIGASASASAAPFADDPPGGASLGSVLYWAVYYAYSFGLLLLAFGTITLPKTIFAILHWSGFISVELNFQKLLVLFMVFAVASSYTYKLKVLNKYSQLPATERLSKRHGDGFYDLHPDVANSDSSQPSGFHNYLDEFLSAIRVFGFLEKPVFHELARHLQTRRLLAGDTLSLDEDKSFYIVMDGTVQVFTRSHKFPTTGRSQTGFSDQDASHAYDDEDHNGFQLLNEVESGGTLSSLFTILSLFTEDVKLRYEEESPVKVPPSYATAQKSPRMQRASSLGAGDLFHNLGKERDIDVATLQLDPGVPGDFHTNPESAATTEEPSILRLPNSDGASLVGSGSETERETVGGGDTGLFTDVSSEDEPPHTARQDLPPGFAALSAKASSGSTSGRTVPILCSEPASGTGTPYGPGRFHPRHSHGSRRSTAKAPSEHPEALVARATVDTTLAVIPAEAFRRLTKRFPNAAAHIVQVILTRLQRVTFLTAHKHLGLTKEVIRTEKAFNDLACFPLPTAFYEGGGMARLRARFAPETRLIDEPDGVDYFSAEPSATWDDSPMRSAAPGGWGSEALRGVKSRRRAGWEAPSRNTSKGFGDLLTMTNAQPEVPRASRPTHVSSGSNSSARAGLATSLLYRHPSRSSRRSSNFPSLSLGGLDGFNLRQHVMDCIAKSIGLMQGPFSPPNSAEASPFLGPQDRPGSKSPFKSSLGSLSFLGTLGLDDESSASATASSATGPLMPEEFENEVEILYFPRGSTLVKAEERNPGLYFVIDGFLDVLMPPDEDATPPAKPVGDSTTIPPLSKPAKPTKFGGSVPLQSYPNRSKSGLNQAAADRQAEGQSQVLFSVKPGGIAGYLASISGFPSYVDIKAKTDAYVGLLPARSLESIMDKRPIVLLTLAKRLISLLSPLVLHIDSALEWMSVGAGQVIYRAGDRSDSFFIVISGRLRTIRETDDGAVEVLGEFGLGDSIGELDCITGSPRPSTLHAIRDSELVRMPMTLFNAISIRHPAISVQLSRMIASRVRQQVTSNPSTSLPNKMPATELGKNNFNLKTVAILPTTRNVPVVQFAERLRVALEGMGAATSYLNQATVLAVLGRHAFSRMGKLKLAGWLAETEQKHRLVMYVCDAPVNAPWTQTCVRQADCVIVVGDGGADPEIGEYERLLMSMKTTARKELVLLHPDRNVPPGSTRPWLKPRPWIHAHHHMQMPGSTPLADHQTDELPPVTALRNLKERVQTHLKRHREAVPAEVIGSAVSDDFARLARRLCGKSIGVVFGGGGARGITHIGVLRALQEQGIPIDMVGGTSIGAFVGGVYARHGDLISTLGRTKTFAGRMSTLWRILTDLTYPVVAYTTGHEFNRGIYKAFRNVHIEDFWLPFWTNTTSLRWSKMQIHTTGYAWRYVRASMSLAGLLPPLCDDGDMLVDGGYIDNLPVSVMLRQGADSIFAVDVGSIDDTSPRNFPESVSGWWVLINRWNPWSTASSIPTLTDIQSRLTYISSVKTLEEAKVTPGVLYMRMPTEAYATLDFKKFPEILDTGYISAKSMIKDFEREGRLPTGTIGGFKSVVSRRKGWSARRNSI